MADTAPTPMQYLVCLDGSKEAQAVVPLVRHMASSTDFVTLFSCFKAFSVLSSPEAQATAHQKVVAAAATELVKELPDTQVDAHVEQVGDPRLGIMAYVATKQARTILMSSRGLGSFGAWAMGSVSSYVLHNTTEGTAVVISRGLDVTSSTLHYMLCVDGSVRSQRAGCHLAQIIKPTDRVTVYASYVTPPRMYPVVLPVAEGMSSPAEIPNPDYESECAERLQSATTKGESVKSQFGLESQPRGFVVDDEKRNLDLVVKGVPEVRQGILDAADGMKADVIVVGSKGTGELVGAVLGSVAHFLSHHTEKRALMVVH